MTFEIVIPDGAVSGNEERRGFVRHSELIRFGNEEAKRGSIVEDSNVEPVGRFALRVEKFDFYAVAMIGSDGMNAMPWVAFVNVVRLQSLEFGSLRQIDAIERELHWRWFDDLFVPAGKGVAQFSLIEEEFESNGAVRAWDARIGER